MSNSVIRAIEIMSLLALVALCLWLTAFALFGSVISILLILGLMLSFAAAKEPYRKGFICLVLLSALFISNPTEVKLRSGGNMNVKLLPISYGLLGEDLRKQQERDEIVRGGCVVTPFSRQWRLLVELP